MDVICKGKFADDRNCTYKAQPNGYCKIHKSQAEPVKSCITITFGDVAENHVRMQKIGVEAKEGFSLNDVIKFKEFFDQLGYKTEIFCLNAFLESWDNPDNIKADDAHILIVRNGCNALLSDIGKDKDQLHAALNRLEWDTKAIMYKKVVNKKARYNLCFGGEHQNADIENGKGTVIAFDEVPELFHIRTKLSTICKDKCSNLAAEGNLYYDVKKCGIGFHGDAERKLVLAIRFGESMELAYQWYYKTKRVGIMAKFMLHHGDFYIMSAKAVGNDWQKKNILTLRHAAGCASFLK